MDVLIATHGRAELLARTLRHIIPAATSGLVDRIVVVENGGESGARLVCDRMAFRDQLLFLVSTSSNKSSALNMGLRYCCSPLIFMTDDDTLVPPETLVAYSAWESQGAGCYMGGPMRVRADSSPADWLAPYLPRSARGWEIEAKEPEEKEPFLGCNWAAFRSDLYRVGGFDPSFGPGSVTGATGQETNMQRRLRRLGVIPRYLPGAYVVHDVDNDSFTKEWVLHRGFRNGVAEGINHAKGDLDGALKRARSRQLHDLAKALFALISPSEFVRFRTDHSKRWGQGFRHGVQLVRSGQIPDPPFLERHM